MNRFAGARLSRLFVHAWLSWCRGLTDRGHVLLLWLQGPAQVSPLPGLMAWTCPAHGKTAAGTRVLVRVALEGAPQVKKLCSRRSLGMCDQQQHDVPIHSLYAVATYLDAQLACDPHWVMSMRQCMHAYCSNYVSCCVQGGWPLLHPLFSVCSTPVSPTPLEGAGLAPLLANVKKVGCLFCHDFQLSCSVCCNHANKC